MRLRASRLRALPIALVFPSLVLGGLVLGGCDDDRGAPTQPDTGILNGDMIFATAVTSSLFLSFINETASILLAVDDSPDPVAFPVVVMGCPGTVGFAEVDRDDTDPHLYHITFGDADEGVTFAPYCDIQFDLVGNLDLRFVETHPGLEFLVSMPFDHLTGSPEGLTARFFDEFTFQVTTPYDQLPDDGYPEQSIRYRLDRGRDQLLSPSGAVFDVTGTLRLEDRSRPMMLVEELDIQYPATISTTPPLAGLLQFEFWPAGMYEAAANGISGPGLPAVPGYPVEVYFDGVGGASFELEGNTCETRMDTGQNPCTERP